VLKLGPPAHPELEQELDALEGFAGRGGVRLLELDRARGAVLLERIRPGTRLRALAADDDEAATRCHPETQDYIARKRTEGKYQRSHPLPQTPPRPPDLAPTPGRPARFRTSPPINFLT
jgi:hypothetical protein